MKIINFLILTLFLSLISCKKEEEIKIDPCANGILDAGEEEIDCGGTCKDCAKVEYLLINYEDSSFLVSNKSLQFDGTNWILSTAFNEIEFNINLGSNGDVGIYPITSLNSNMLSEQLSYTFDSGIIGISEHDVTNKRMSGNFEASFYRGNDTIKISSGQFENLTY